MQHVALVHGDQVYELEHEALRHEVTGDVEVHAPPGEGGLVGDLHPRQLERWRRLDGRHPPRRVGKELAKRLQAVKDAGRPARGHGHSIVADLQAIALDRRTVLVTVITPLEHEPDDVAGRC